MERRTELEDLVTGAQAGNLRAFDALVYRFQGYAVRYAASLLGDTDRAQDAAQEAFLEIFRRLPTLRYPVAFPELLRRLVRKHCDRSTRRGERGLSLYEATNIAATTATDPEYTVLQRESSADVHNAVDSLPGRERAVVYLYYLGEHTCVEVADVLGVPVSTVKNRLHTARRRLRERMEYGMEDTEITAGTASSDRRFRDRVFAELFAEYRRQREQDPATADRSLLIRARDSLREQIENTVIIDLETVRVGRELLFGMGEYADAARLLMLYLHKPGISVSEEIWAQYGRLLALASQYTETGAATVVAEHPIFVRQVQAGAARRTIFLKEDGDFLPIGMNAPDRIPNACLPLWALGPMEIPNNYIGAGDRLDNWLTTAEEVLSATPQSRETRRPRCKTLYSMATQLALCGRTDDALEVAARIHALAFEETDDPYNPLWRIESESAVMYIRNQTGGSVDKLRLAASRAIAELDAWESNLLPGDSRHQEVADQRHNVAFLLRRTEQYDMAASLFEGVLASGRGNAWTHLWAAGALWARDGDTAETRAVVLPLLRTAAERYSGDGFYEHFRRQKEFREVSGDPEFIAAVR